MFMASLDLSIYSGFMGAGVKDEDAKRAAEALSAAIDKRFDEKSRELATKSDIHDVQVDIAALKIDIIRWNVVTVFGGLAVLSIIQKLL
jgi:hypothetical protein